MSVPAARPSGGNRRQAGFSLVAAIFLIVVLAALGAFAVQVAMSQYQSANLEFLEARAQAAAQAGIEYGSNQTLHRSPAPCASGNTSNTFTLAGGALKGFIVTVTCAATAHQIYSGTPLTPHAYEVYALSATASRGTYGEPDYVARTVTRNVTNAPH
jgi:MSHA biogenesis protein MshP